MPTKHIDEMRDHAFADQALALRKRTGLTQIQLAEQLGVTTQTIYTWEAGLASPGADRLKQVLAFYLDHGALNAGREVEHAQEVWEAVRERATQRLEPFDAAWFTSPAPTSLSSSPGDLPPTNLPPTRTSLIGRDDAIIGVGSTARRFA